MYTLYASFLGRKRNRSHNGNSYHPSLTGVESLEPLELGSRPGRARDASASALNLILLQLLIPTSMIFDLLLQIQASRAQCREQLRRSFCLSRWHSICIVIRIAEKARGDALTYQSYRAMPCSDGPDDWKERVQEQSYLGKEP
jgi:hypothetical protein